MDALDRTDWHLANWAKWMRSGGMSHLLYTVSLGYKGSTEFDEMCDAADRVAARATDALIADLPPAQACAVRHVWLGEVWRFPRDNLEDLIDSAKRSIQEGLTSRGIY